MLAKTLSLPLCAIPMATSCTSWLAATLIIASKAAIVVSPPSKLKRF